MTTLSPRAGRERETSGRKSWGSAEAGAGGAGGAGGASSPGRPAGGPDEQRSARRSEQSSLASDDSPGRVSSILLIPPGAPAQYGRKSVV